jgi:hypothetical protein
MAFDGVGDLSFASYVAFLSSASLTRELGVEAKKSLSDKRPGFANAAECSRDCLLVPSWNTDQGV